VLHLPRQISPDAEIVPTLALPLGVVVTEGVGFAGLLATRLGVGTGPYSDEDAVLAGKALGDLNRVRIVQLLTRGSLYNLQIATQIGLTPATTSHHMSLLLAAGLVRLEKRDGKVFYHLSRDGLKRYRDWLRDLRPSG